MRLLYALILLLIGTYPLNAQEICNDGIDNDGDGLIDCYDPDCCTNIVCQDHYYSPCDTSYTCQVDSFAANFSIRQLWQSPEIVNNIIVPMVGDLDADGVPEIVTSRLSSTTNGIVIIDGQTGATKQLINVSTRGTTYNIGICLADVDNDGQAEIVYPAGDHRLYCYEQNGTLLWSNAQTVTTDWGQIVSTADFNHDGKAEIYAGRYLFDGATGILLGSASGSYATTGGQPGIGDFANPVAMDVLPTAACTACAGLEYVAGNTVYTVDIDTITNTATITPFNIINTEPDGLTAVADWDGDGDLDGIITHISGNAARLYVWDLQTTNLIGTTGIVARGIGSGTIGVAHATAADIDQDGLLEAVFTLNGRLVVVENNFSIKWSALNNDRSGSTGSTLYDFNGDGNYELVYRDETTLRIFDANTGTVLSSIGCTSGTGLERPIVADINADGQTEILCTCNGFVSGQVTAFGADLSPWMPARPLWNQYQYSAVNINDDLTVPRVQQAHHLVGDGLVLNSFAKQYQNEVIAPVPDATIQINSINIIPPDSIDIEVQICNAGDNILAASTPISFYDDDPSLTAANLLGQVVVLGQNLAAGDCVIQTYRIQSTTTDVYAVVNCDNSIPPSFNFTIDFPITNIGECDYTNNMASSSVLLHHNLEVFEAAQVAKGQVQLVWQLTTNSPVANLTLQRQTNNNTFETIATDLSLTGAWTDVPPLATYIYYRLVWQDETGQPQSSVIKAIELDMDQFVKPRIFPNPTTDNITIQSSTAITQWELYDALGRLLKRSGSMEAQQLSLSLENLPTGRYYLRLQSLSHWHQAIIMKQ